ncbi:hypothetical protein MO867_21670, partial [Microbulbifer sp. OS29]
MLLPLRLGLWCNEPLVVESVVPGGQKIEFLTALAGLGFPVVVKAFGHIVDSVDQVWAEPLNFRAEFIRGNPISRQACAAFQLDAIWSSASLYWFITTLRTVSCSYSPIVTVLL